jgi:hypothetical protein
LLGLLDYFSIKHSKKIVTNLSKNVKSKGTLLLTNAHPSNPTRFLMEYVSEWYSNYKTKEEIYQIVDNQDSANRIDYKIDAYGVYQHLILDKS